MAIGLHNYDFEEKNKWRNWAWNKIRQHTGKKTKESIVLYMPSFQDLDRKVAIKKGFNEHNLIAVEKNPSVVKSLRKMGVNVIDGDLFDIIDGANGIPKINVVFADLVNGITFETLQFSITTVLTSNWVSNQFIFAINLLRGRDRWSRVPKEFESFWKEEGLFKKSKWVIEPTNMHRGKILSLFMFAVASSHGTFGTYDSDTENPNLGMNLKVLQKRHDLFYMKRRVAQKMQPKFYSYKSLNGRTTFDSVVMFLDKRWFPIWEPEHKKTMTMKIAAAKAIRTMKINRNLLSSDLIPQGTPMFDLSSTHL